MLMEQLDDEFYHEDFTNETPWEEFNASLLDLFSRWKLNHYTTGSPPLSKGTIFSDDDSNTHFHIEQESIKFTDEYITIKYYRAKDLSTSTSLFNPIDCESVSVVHRDLCRFCEDFALPQINITDNDSNLNKFFGLRRFIVLEPKNSLPNASCSLARLLLSSISVVVGGGSDVAADMAIFLQIGSPINHHYMGMSFLSGKRIEFTVSSWNIGDGSECDPLQFLSSLFREKLSTTIHESRDIKVSVRQVFNVGGQKMNKPNCLLYKPCIEETTMGGLLTSNITQPFDIVLDEPLNLPLGFKDFCKSEMYTVFSWPGMNERLVVADLLPSKAVRAFFMMKVQVESYLTDCLRSYESFNDRGDHQTLDFDSESFVWYLSPILTQHSDDPEFWDQEQDEKIGHLLAYWRKHSFAEEIKMTTNDDLQEVEEYLFPVTDHGRFSYKPISEEMEAQRYKSAPRDSLVCRLSCLLAYYWNKSNLRYWYLTWRCFATHIGLFWDTGVRIPGVASGPPDRRTCLLHQKLQMLNLCIEEKRRLHQGEMVSKNDANDGLATNVKDNDKDKDDDDDDNDDDDEFLDCNDAEDMIMVANIKPEGRLRPLNQLKLLNGMDNLYEPITVEPPPETEDRLVLAEEKLLKNIQNQVDFTQNIQRSLISDMSSFKAANPQGKFEDFIRWYSPRDWQEESGEEGGMNRFNLSARMSVPGNIWQQLWETAMPLPASEQAKHNIGTLEAIRVIDFIEASSKSLYIYELTIVPLLHSAITIYQSIFQKLDILELFEESLECICQELSSRAKQLTVNSIGRVMNPRPRFQSVIEKIHKLETDFYKWLYLEKSFVGQTSNKDQGTRRTKDEVKRLYYELCQNGGNFLDISDEEVAGGGDTTLFSRSYLNPFRNETIFKETHLDSIDYLLWNNDNELNQEDSLEKMPQLLWAHVNKDRRMRICSAFTENTLLLETP